MVLGEVIHLVGVTWLPKDVVLTLAGPVTDLIKMHVNGLGAFLLDVVIGNASGCGIVGLNWCFRLFVAKFL